MLDSVSSNNCFTIPKHILGSNQLQIQQRTVSLFASACLILQIHEVNHQTILNLPFKQLVASFGYLCLCKIRLKFNLNFKYRSFIGKYLRFSLCTRDLLLHIKHSCMTKVSLQRDLHSKVRHLQCDLRLQVQHLMLLYLSNVLRTLIG